MDERARVVEDTERWFLARGLPHLIDDYSATRDVFTRDLPILTLIFLFEMGGALNADWEWWQNVFAAVGGFGFLLAVWVLTNRLRNRPAFARPESVGRAELATFVLAPALVPLLFGGQILQAVGVAAANVLVLAAIYAITSYGLVPLTRWAFGRVGQELRAVVGLLARALPLLIVVIVFLFFTPELWQVVAPLGGVALGALLALFALIGIGFLLTRLPDEIGRIAAFAEGDDVVDCCKSTPVAEVAAGAEAHLAAAGSTPLGRRQRGNLILVVLVSEAVQIILVTATIGVFFVLLGLLILPPETIAAWVVKADVDEIARATLIGHEMVLTVELLKVAGFLAVFAGFSFTLSLVTDATYREEFFAGLESELREALAVRAVYLTLVPELRSAAPPVALRP